MSMALTKPDFTEELCATCKRRLPGMYCPEYGHVMPDHCPACKAWQGDGDD